MTQLPSGEGYGCLASSRLLPIQKFLFPVTKSSRVKHYSLQEVNHTSATGCYFTRNSLTQNNSSEASSPTLSPPYLRSVLARHLTTFLTTPLASSAVNTPSRTGDVSDTASSRSERRSRGPHILCMYTSTNCISLKVPSGMPMIRQKMSIKHCRKERWVQEKVTHQPIRE